MSFLERMACPAGIFSVKLDALLCIRFQEGSGGGAAIEPTSLPVHPIGLLHTLPRF